MRLIFFLLNFSGRTAKSFLANILTLVVKKTYDQDLNYSLATPNYISVKIVPEVVIREACGTLHGLYAQ